MEEIKNNIGKLKSLAIKVFVFALLFMAIDYVVSEFLTIGLEKYYGLDKPAELVLIGHSHTMLGLDKGKLEEELHCRVAKYAIEGANVQDRFTMIKHFVHQNGDSIKAITYDVDAWFITGEGLSVNSYKLFFPFMYDKYINEHVRNGAKENMEQSNASFEYYLKKWIRTSRFTDLNLNGSLRGHLGFYSNIKIGTIDVESYKKRVESGDYQNITFDEDLKIIFEEMLEFTSEENIDLILLGIPTIGILNRTDPENYAKAMSMLQEYADKYDNVHFLDYNPLLEDQYDLFYDPVHLGPKGNEVVTEMVSKDLKQLGIFN